MIMNQYKGEVKGKLGDKERTFRLTFESIVNIENKTGKSIIYGIQNYLKPYPSLESININCYDFTKESLMKANLKVSVNTHEFMDFIINN